MSWGKLTSTKLCFAFIITDVPAFQQWRFNAAEGQKKVSVSNNDHHLWQARRISSVLLGTGGSALLKTEQRQSLTNQMQIFQWFTVAVPWIWPGCQMRTGCQIQNGRNRELVSQSSHVGPGSQSCTENYNWASEQSPPMRHEVTAVETAASCESVTQKSTSVNGLKWETGQALRRSSRPVSGQG